MTAAFPTRGLFLYADDDRDDVQLVADAFGAFQDQIDLVTFSNGAQLLKYLEGLPSNIAPCLIILDINMPVLNGRETLALIRESGRYKDTPVVMFSTSNTAGEREYARLFNAVFHSKPIHFAQLTAIVKEMVLQCTELFRLRLEGRQQ
jgi:CheY-like chemotaxis protein